MSAKRLALVCTAQRLPPSTTAEFRVLREARNAGYKAMQFNFVVSTNLGAVSLWKKLGFSIVGTVPRTFKHHQLGYVDAYVMRRFLNDGEQQVPADGRLSA
jgi:hypothetical protein